MVHVSYPGVYIQEVPSGVHTITSVATSITAFIDWFKEGPSNKAVEIFGMTDFGRVFGGLDDRSEASYAISQFFLNGGGTALVVRVAAAGSAVKAGIKLHSNTVSNADVLDVTAANEGVWGNNLRLDIDYNTIDPSTKEVGTLFNLTVTRYDGPGLKAKAIATESFLNLTLDPIKPRSTLSARRPRPARASMSPSARRHTMSRWELGRLERVLRKSHNSCSRRFEPRVPTKIPHLLARSSKRPATGYASFPARQAALMTRANSSPSAMSGPTTRHRMSSP